MPSIHRRQLLHSQESYKAHYLHFAIHIGEAHDARFSSAPFRRGEIMQRNVTRTAQLIDNVLTAGVC
jgi:hypothetical protein